eukprot:CAMPEP_0198136950 /NCGR_PEP_ID=MMETSP1443-20131203/491_1 /TAXON_ID=186043 /ORGANISM="Entomoneis sp., Strain CCMP2396" /LENGTH=550 /DNA_ID=CAMNT_0043798257 /DNA_START=114 /DNA_END=1766 /DNA_ORIENTATION=+
MTDPEANDDVPEQQVEEAAPAAVSYHRQMSVSEAAESSGAGLNAPSWLAWFEYPFAVPDPDTGKKLPEATGWAMDSVGRGPLNQVGSYTGSAILRAAIREAGCFDCTTHGFKPSSLLTLMTSIVGVIAAILMPIVGAVVDHTAHRRMLGVVSGFLAVALIGAQIFITEDNWFGMLIIDAVQTFAFLVHTTTVFAYLPDLTLDQNVLSHYTSRFNLRQYVGQFIFVSLVIIAGEARGADRSVESSLQTAKDSAGMAFGYGALFLGYAWTFLFRERPPLSKIPEGSNMLTSGFNRILETSGKVWRDYNHLRWFMASLLFSPEAGAGVVLSIAITFLTVFMKFSGVEIAKSSLCLMAGNVLGSLISKWLCRVINPLNSYRIGLTTLGASIGLSVLILTGPERRDYVYGFAAFWGVTMGWTYPSQRVLFCTLIPKGQETEFMGLFVFTGQIMGWVPSLIVTIMNENDVDIRYSLAIVGIFCIAAVILTIPMGSYEHAVKMVAEDSQEKLREVVEATSRHMRPSSRSLKIEGKPDTEITTEQNKVEDEPPIVHDA